MKKVAIIGAGPAGIYTALFLDNQNFQVDLYEKNKNIGAKLTITGGGKMNLGNKNFSEKRFYSAEKNILRNIFKKPYAKNVMQFFDELGVKYKWDGDRAILLSESAKSEVDRLNKKLINQKNLNLFLGHEIKKIEKSGDYFIFNEQIYDVLILCCGGRVCIGNNCKRNNGYELASQFGHKVAKISPALCPLIFSDNFFSDLIGLSMHCKLTDMTKKESLVGDLIFTHTGISGPVVLDFSLVYEGGRLEINFLPEINEADFKKCIEKNRQGKVKLKKILNEFFPKRFAFWQLDFAEIETNQIIADLKKDKLKKLLSNIFRFQIDKANKDDFKSSWTSRGGVDLREIKYSSLESRLHDNLFFAGEILDITGLCGGFNISFAMLSARIIAENIIHN